MDSTPSTDDEFNAMWNQLAFGDVWVSSIVTTSRFKKGQLAGIHVAGGFKLCSARRRSSRAAPAAAEVARAILERVAAYLSRSARRCDSFHAVAHIRSPKVVSPAFSVTRLSSSLLAAR